MIDISHSLVRFHAAGNSIAGYLAHPADGERHPGIVIAPEVFGLVGHAQDVARRFARDGFVALAVDIYSRRGTPRKLDSEAAIEAFTPSVSDVEAVRDLRAGLDFLITDRRVFGGQIGIVGIGIGGSQAVLAAVDEPRFRAVVDCYGPLRYSELSPRRPVSPIDAIARLTTPFLGIFGGGDPAITATDVETLRGALVARDIPHQIDLYDDAAAGFLNDARDSHDFEASTAAFRSMTTFLRLHLAERAAHDPD